MRGCGGGAGQSKKPSSALHFQPPMYATPAHLLLLGTHLLQPGPQKAPDQKLKPLQLRLHNDELEIGLRVHAARLLFHELNLPTPLAQHSQPHIPLPLFLLSLQQLQLCTQPKATANTRTCRPILSNTLPINSSGQLSISGALRSATHARVSSCKSLVSCGVASTSTSASKSSISIIFSIRHERRARTVLGRWAGPRLGQRRNDIRVNERVQRWRDATV